MGAVSAVAFSPDGTELALFEGGDAVASPLSASGSGADPVNTLATAEDDALLTLEGFELVAPASAPEAQPTP